MSVRPEQVSVLAGQIRQGATGIRSELDALEHKIGQLRAAWGGQAQVAYDQAQRGWTAQIGQLQELLVQIAAKTEEISSGYVNTDSQAAKRFSL